MAALAALTGRPVEKHHPWPRLIVTNDTWLDAIDGLVRNRWTLSGLWGDDGVVHMALTAGADVRVLSLPCLHGRFPSVGYLHPPAIRLERTIADLFGLQPLGAADTRPWLDHGNWGLRHPLGARRDFIAPEPYPFLSAQGDGIHQVPVGPVHAGIIEPGHFRFHANGETIVRLEARLGYTHKGTEALMRGSDLDRAAKLAGRVSGDSTVAYAIAFARATEAALNVQAPDRAHWLRALMAEMERIANHLGDIGAICNDASFSLMHAHSGVLRERVLRTADVCFGHRLMHDCIVPGGVTRNLSLAKEPILQALVKRSRRGSPAWRPFTITPPRCRTALLRLVPSRWVWPKSSVPADISAAPLGEILMRGEPSPTRPTIGYPSKCRSSRRATSMPAFGSAFVRLSRVSR